MCCAVKIMSHERNRFTLIVQTVACYGLLIRSFGALAASLPFEVVGLWEFQPQAVGDSTEICFAFEAESREAK